jgi:hypothetical protein
VEDGSLSFADPDLHVDAHPEEEAREHARFHAQRSAAGIGAAVLRSGFTAGEHYWDCVVTDGEAWHYIRVIGRDVGPYPAFSAPQIGRAIERFVARLPPAYRLRGLINANPLHIDRSGAIDD